MKPAPLIRLPQWEGLLTAYLERVTEVPFAWGSNDCALFAASAVQAMTGIDPAEGLRGTYRTALGAAEALRQHGAGTLLKTVTLWLGEPKHVAQAHRGDIVMLNRLTCGVCVGRWTYFVGQPESMNRMIWLPTSQCRYAFTLPYGPAA